MMGISIGDITSSRYSKIKYQLDSVKRTFFSQLSSLSTIASTSFPSCLHRSS